MSRWRWSVMLVCVSVTMAACAGNGGPIPLTEVETKYLDAVCEHGVRCGDFPDVATCRQAIFPRVDQEIASVQAGRVTYDGIAASSCFDVIRRMGCNRTDELANPPISCVTTFTGMVPAGGTCYTNLECHSGRCDRSSCAATCCAGTCEPGAPAANPVPVGGDCSMANATCVENAACVYVSTADTATCLEGVALGEACDPVGWTSGECLHHGACMPSGSALGGTCVAPPSTGQVCGADSLGCNSSNDYCDPSTNTCSPRLPVGAPCPAGGCVGYALCDSVTGRCVARGRPGEGCDDMLDSCMGSLRCEGGVCAVPSFPAVCP